MNSLNRDIKQGEIVISDDGQAFEVHGGNGIKRANLGKSIYAFPIDPDTKERIGDLCEIGADIDPILTASYASNDLSVVVR